MTSAWSQKDPTDPFVTTPPGVRAARLAAGQWSILALADLLACGLTYSGVKVLVRQGHLHPLYRGVFAWGHPNVAQEGRWLAAVKACGPDAVLSHFAAGCLHGLATWDGRPIDITAPSKHRHPRIKAHRSKTIQRIIVKGIPVTPKLRTVVDLGEGRRRGHRQARPPRREVHGR
jgi:hypothetical protein